MHACLCGRVFTRVCLRHVLGTILLLAPSTLTEAQRGHTLKDTCHSAPLPHRAPYVYNGKSNTPGVKRLYSKYC